MEKKDYAVVAAVCGEGMGQLFMQMGADGIVYWGRKTDKGSLLSSLIHYSEQRIIFIPCGRESRLVAERLAESGAVRLSVISAESSYQTYAALQALTQEDAEGDPIGRAQLAAASVRGCEISCDEAEAEDMLMDFIRRSAIAGNISAITLLVGRSVGHDLRVSLTERIGRAYPLIQLSVFLGGQRGSRYCLVIE